MNQIKIGNFIKTLRREKENKQADAAGEHPAAVFTLPLLKTFSAHGTISHQKSLKERGMSEEKKNSFFEEVYKVVARIPAGKVMSYGQIARVLGAPRAARQVGWAMRCCPDDIPWQRVVKDSGEIAGGGHADFRRILLEEERVSFLPDGRVDMEKCRYVPTIELLLMEDEE